MRFCFITSNALRPFLPSSFLVISHSSIHIHIHFNITPLWPTTYYIFLSQFVGVGHGDSLPSRCCNYSKSRKVPVESVLISWRKLWAYGEHGRKCERSTEIMCLLFELFWNSVSRVSQCKSHSGKFSNLWKIRSVKLQLVMCTLYKNMLTFEGDLICFCRCSHVCLLVYLEWN